MLHALAFSHSSGNSLLLPVPVAVDAGAARFCCSGWPCSQWELSSQQQQPLSIAVCALLYEAFQVASKHVPFAAAVSCAGRCDSALKAACVNGMLSCRIGTSYSGWRPSVVNKAFAHTAIKVTNDILRATKPRGPGGFDFLSGGQGSELIGMLNQSQ